MKLKQNPEIVTTATKIMISAKIRKNRNFSILFTQVNGAMTIMITIAIVH